MIKAPGWCSHAIPTTRGWKHPRTSEILKKRAIHPHDIAAWHRANGSEPTPEPVELVTPLEEHYEVEVEDEAPINLDTMNKVELEALGREMGIELDRRKTKAVLLAQLKELMDV
jgi:hypothetical protein